MDKKDNAFLRTLSSFGRLVGSLFSFGKMKRPVDMLAEEAIMSPSKVIVKNFFRNKLAISGLIGFSIMLTVVFLGAALNPLTILETNPIMRDTKPGLGYTNISNEAKKAGLVQISNGTTYGIGLGKDGNVYAWGQDVLGSTKIPAEVNALQIKKIASGDRHVIALTTTGKIYGWGRNNFKQAIVPAEIEAVLMLENIVDIFAGDQYSAILTDKNKIHVWGTTFATGLDIVPIRFQGRIVKAAQAPYNILLILDDGSVGIMGERQTALDRIPTPILNKDVQIVDAAVTVRTAIAVDTVGQVYVWGENEFGLLTLPEGIRNEKIVSVAAGRAHFIALAASGKVFTWGSNAFKQLALPKDLAGKKVVSIAANYYQTYAIAEDGNSYGWGQNGYYLGTDDLGRDMLMRLIHGGRVTMTVGAVAVLISTTIGLLVGLISGFYGGWIDNILMRFTEVINSFPFLPMAITLSSFVGGILSQTERLLLIMVILGVISWTGLARLVRGQILAEREKDFVLAARALGIRSNVIILRHILPNVINVVIVSMTLGYAGSLLTEAGLSFLGFGVIPPSPSWGNMLTGAQDSTVITFYWWRWILPAVAVLIAALTVNIIGDGLRDAMDPKNNEK
ncbi:MAG: ABC transporter permease subunit [Erysipelotrichaceae bacterium]|nr:ABC transporter permease subunit [Erysipelotrichaceae bacterium]MDP3304834.1 ABC transporter permease subunit [Erysipelotrichaceae bacterium]